LKIGNFEMGFSLEDIEHYELTEKPNLLCILRLGSPVNIQLCRKIDSDVERLEMAL
jgi:hypothetical protein